jgi:hypothetical protein
MAFDADLANAISNTFRVTVINRLNTPQRTFFEQLLQVWLGIKNIRNVQLWTREGAQTRQFINNRLGEVELDLRVFIATKFIQGDFYTSPVKQKCWRMPPTFEIARDSLKWFFDPYIREYCTRIYFADLFFCIEYAADSNTPPESINLDSPEFDDVLED